MGRLTGTIICALKQNTFKCLFIVFHLIGQNLNCNYCSNEVLPWSLLRKRSHSTLKHWCYLLYAYFLNLPPNLFQQQQQKKGCGKPDVLWPVDRNEPFLNLFPSLFVPYISLWHATKYRAFCHCDPLVHGRQFLAFITRVRTLVFFHLAI